MLPLDRTQTVEHCLELGTLAERLCNLKGFVAWHQRRVLGEAHQVVEHAQWVIPLTASMRLSEDF